MLTLAGATCLGLRPAPLRARAPVRRHRAISMDADDKSVVVIGSGIGGLLSLIHI